VAARSTRRPKSRLTRPRIDGGLRRTGPRPDRRKAIYANILRDMRNAPSYSEYFTRLRSTARSLDPENSPSQSFREAYNALVTQLEEKGMRLKVLDTYQTIDAHRTYRKYGFAAPWEWLKIQYRRVRRGNQMKRLQRSFDKLDEKIYDKYDYPFAVARRMIQMDEIAKSIIV